MADDERKPLDSERPEGAGEAAPGGAVARRLARLAIAAAAVALACVGLVIAFQDPASDELDQGLPRAANARAAYEAAERALEWSPDDLAGALARFARVESAYRGSEWARRAAERVADLTWEQDDATRARADEKLRASLVALREGVNELLASHEFALALHRLEVFEQRHPLEAAICEAVSLRGTVVARAEARYGELVRAVEASLERKDYAGARAHLEPVKQFGISELVERARRKVAEIDSRERHGEQWAEWHAARVRVKQLTESGDFDEALDLLERSKGLPPENADALVAEAREAVVQARRRAAREAIAAYEERSSDVWLLFMERSYPEAEQLIDELRGWPDYRLADEHVEADEAALEVLRGFWAAVERGVAARVGKSFVVRDLAGTLLDFGNGVAVLRAADAEEGELVFSVPIRELSTEQAVAAAGLGDDARSWRMLGVLLLAEGGDLDALERARKALDVAGDGPFLRIYKQKLATARRHMAESDAEAAWQKIAPFLDEWLTGFRAMIAHSLLSRFQADYADTEFIKRVAGEIATLRERIRRAAGRPRFVMKVVARTAPDGPAGSDDLRVSVLINGDDRYRRRLDRFHYDHPRGGAVDTYHFDFYSPMPEVKGMQVAVEGRGAWKCESIEFRFFHRREWTRPKRFAIGQVLSSERAAVEQGARESLWLPFTSKSR